MNEYFKASIMYSPGIDGEMEYKLRIWDVTDIVVKSVSRTCKCILAYTVYSVYTVFIFLNIDGPISTEDGASEDKAFSTS